MPSSFNQIKEATGMHRIIHIAVHSNSHLDGIYKLARGACGEPNARCRLGFFHSISYRNQLFYRTKFRRKHPPPTPYNLTAFISYDKRGGL